MMTDNHEMRRCHDGIIRAIYTDDEGCQYAIIDSERDYSYGDINRPLSEEDIAALADDHEADCYEDEGEAAFGRGD